MQYIIYFIFICIIVFIIFLNQKKSAYQEKEFDQLIENYKQNGIDKYIQENKEKLEFEIRYDLKRLEDQRDQINAEISGKQTALQEISSKVKTYEEQLRDIALTNAKQYEETLINIAKDKVKAEQEKMQKAAQESFEKTMAEMDAQAEAARAQIEILTKEIAEYSAKQVAINEAILRQRALEEQQDFCRICLTPEAKSDISYLISIIPNLKNPTALYKLIWSEYIQKQFNQMLKNVLGATDPRNVIYSITNLKTNEIYIGKTKAEVSKRWSEHIKSSLNIGTIKSAKIHEALYNHWDEFTFAVVEKVPLEENLSMREKFYIDFYQSNIYGYNLKSGG